MVSQQSNAPIADEEALYRHAAALNFADLSATTVESGAAAVLDHFGCAILGMTLPWTEAVLAMLDEAGELGTPADGKRAHVYGLVSPVSAMTAALVNGTATHGFDFDDTHLPTMSHPGCIVIPAAVAASEVSGSGGREFLTAVTVGYEVTGRIARATGLGFGEKGFHATGQVGPMGAAAACARLVVPGPEDDPSMIAGAVGLAASFGGGIKAFSTGAGVVKRLHAGRAAQAGLLAAMLQRFGFAGPQAGVAGKFGFVPTFSTDQRPDYLSLSAGLGERYVVDEVYLKPYAACGAVHGAVAAASSLAVMSADDVDRVVVGTSRRALEQNSIPEPAGVVAAQYSTEYSVALAMLGWAGDARRYLDAGSANDAPVRDLTAKVSLEVDEAVDRAYPDSNEARIEVWLRDGTVRSARGAVSAATSRGWSVAEKKFLDITSGLIDPSSQHRVIEAVAGLAGGGTIQACLEAIGEIEPPGR